MKYITNISLALLCTGLFACNKKQEQAQPEEKMDASKNIELQKKIEEFAPTLIKGDISHLTDNQKQVVKLLAEAGHIAEDIFWKQSSHDAIAVRDSLKALDSEEAKQYLDFVNIHFGPYDVVRGNNRFVGNGVERRPLVAGFYPVDMTKAEFQAYVLAHPEEKVALESQYTVVVRDGENLKAVPYNTYYEGSKKIAEKLEEAAKLADNPSLKKYLELRAKAILTDDYFESDMAWMEIKDNDIDVVIGPIENYQDELFNYKTAHEAVVMVKDVEASKELDMFQKNIDNFEHKLPYDKKYIRKSAGKGNILQITNVLYFGGDCQKGTKTIASSLPNDPRVHAEKGGKKSMYKNMMQAKFDKIVKPIAEVILDPALIPDVNANAFTSFVTLHEISHTLGRGFVFGNDKLAVRKALQEAYSPIEECKADIVGMYNFKHLHDMKLVDDAYLRRTVATYLPGLFRSIRFGTVSAHGRANLVQFNFLLEKGAIVKMDDGKYTINQEIFFDKVGELAGKVLTLEAEGDYEGTKAFLAKYQVKTAAIDEMIEALKDVPRDINTSYEF